MGKPGDACLDWRWQYTGEKGVTGKPHIHQMRRAGAAQKRAQSGGGGQIWVSLKNLCPGRGMAVSVSIQMHVCTDDQGHLRARFKLL